MFRHLNLMDDDTQLRALSNQVNEIIDNSIIYYNLIS